MFRARLFSLAVAGTLFLSAGCCSWCEHGPFPRFRAAMYGVPPGAMMSGYAPVVSGAPVASMPIQGGSECACANDPYNLASGAPSIMSGGVIAGPDLGTPVQMNTPPIVNGPSTIAPPPAFPGQNAPAMPKILTTPT